MSRSRPRARCGCALILKFGVAGYVGALLTIYSGDTLAQSESVVTAIDDHDFSAGLVALSPTIVIGTTPLLGIGTPLSQVPANVQTIQAKSFEQQHGATLTDYLDKNLSGIDIAEAQGNPYQVDINYRGFTASPLLGTPQGLSVFLDSVRINEPFGDVVNWDLIPQTAIDKIQLIPGSHPAFGLNTLGGAIAISTKNGKTAPGGAAELGLGSWGRKTAQIEQGGAVGTNLDYYVTTNVANDNGWADHNASHVSQAFGKLRYTDADTTLSLSTGVANNDLQGTQTIPRSFLVNPRQAYTFPDENLNSVAYLTLSGDHAFNDTTQLSGNVYFRHYRNTNVSSNINDDFGEVDDGQVDDVQGSNAKSAVVADSYGASLQLSMLGKLEGMPNQFVIGSAVDIVNTRYTASTQDAYFTASRATIGVGDFMPQTDAKMHQVNAGLYFNDTLTLHPQWTVTLAGRYNGASVTIGDESGMQPLLNGRHIFSRFNPALGINWNPGRRFAAYASYGEGMRAPTAIELACADPSAPCSLPNDFIADPALKPVISKTIEVGARGHLDTSTTWSAALYRTTLNDDIQFISSGGSNTMGFFQNVGQTRRQGFELAARTRWGPLELGFSYSYVDATYRSSWTENSPSNSSANARGLVTVKPGNHIPGIPANTAKLRLDYAATPKWRIGSNLTYRSSIYARGDEDNQDVNGKIAGYFLVDLDTTYQITKQLQLFASVANLLNKQYASFGILGQNFFTGPNHTFDGNNPTNEQFIGPGAPRSFWVGLRYAWR